ncbi:MAG TPA: hypothetical protein VGG92_13840 [Caulobacteraceae bacterium]|jgi:hypothetical protein
MEESKAIVVVQDPVLASSLELALLAAGVTPVLCDANQEVDSLPLSDATILIVGPKALAAGATDFVDTVRTCGWVGLIILITGDCRKLRGVFKGAYRVAVLEMPFVAADLIAAIKRE